MQWIGGRWWRSRACLGVLAGLLVAVGGGAAITRLDLERRRDDPERLRRLAAAPLEPERSGPSETGAWPQWRGPNRDGVSPETGLAHNWPATGPHLLWKQQIGRGFSSVAVANGRLFTMEEEPADDAASRREAVVCLGAADGREIWRCRYPNHFDEKFGPGPRSTPAVADGLVYALGPTGIFHCVRADTGAVVWRHNLLEELGAPPLQYGMATSPLVEGDLVYVAPGGPGGCAVAAFDRRSGQLAWKALDDPMGYSSPVAATLGGVRQILVLTNAALVSLSPAGELLWRYPWEAPGGQNIATPLVIGDYVFISTAYSKGCALLEVTAGPDGVLQPHRVYELNRMRNYFSGSVRWGDHLYGFDLMDLVCLDLRTGELAWRERGIRSFRKGSVLAADGLLYVLGEGGTLTLAEATPAGYRQRATVKFSATKCWAAPALAEGRLYLRDEAQLFCFDLRP